MNKFEVFNNISYLKSSKGEDALANQVAIELRALSLEGKLQGIWFHVPNESVIRNKTDLIRLKRKQSMGMINGTADFIFIKPGGGLCIELKTAKGRLSESQKLFREWCLTESVDYGIAKSRDEVRDLLKKFRFLT